MLGNCWNVGCKFLDVLLSLVANNGLMNLNPSISKVLCDAPNEINVPKSLPDIACPVGLNLP